MKKKTFLIIIVVLIASIFIIIYSKHIHSNDPMIIHKDGPYYNLYYVSNDKLAYNISIGDSKGNDLGSHTNVSLMDTTKKGTFLVTCPRNSFTDRLVKDNLNYYGMVTFKKLGLTNEQIKQLS